MTPIAGDLIHIVMRLLTFLLLSLLLVLVCHAQRRPNRNRDNRGQLRSGRQQQQRGRNSNRNPNRNKQGGRPGKANQCGGGNKPNHVYKVRDRIVWRGVC